MHRTQSPSRWIWTAPLAAALIAVACDNSLEGIGFQRTWGFVTMSATKNAGGVHFTNPEGLFFLGNLAAVPVADVVQDTCADGGFTGDDNNLSGVTYLDAGPSITATIGGVTNVLERVSTTEGLAYQSALGAFQFNPGDTVEVTIPGTAQGFPGATIRAKTAEPFTFPSVDIPTGTESIQLTWTTPQAPGSSIVVSLRYVSGSASEFNRQVLCTFIDDGVDSIPFRWHQNWSSSTGNTAVVATRLRTNYVGIGDANLGVVSTYQVPTPPNP